MDPVCHTLVGAALAHAGLKRRSPLATAALVFGANAPDIDAVSYFLGDWLWWRRGWTHGILAVVVLPFVVTGGALAWDRFVRARRWPRRHPPVVARELLWVSALAVLTHPALDFLNNYGIRWLMPFADRWFYGDALYIIDPWVSGTLAAGVLASWWLGRRASAVWDAGPAQGALALVFVYATVMLALGQLGRPLVVDVFAERGIEVTGTPMVAPVFANPSRRYVVVEAGDRYLVTGFHWLPLPALEPHARTIERNDTHPAVAAARADPAARGFLRWSRFPFFRVERTPSGFVVLMDDARYAPAGGRSWASEEIHVPHDVARAASPAMATENGLSALPGVTAARPAEFVQSMTGPAWNRAVTNTRLARLAAVLAGWCTPGG
jgi:inner membrane protein